MNKCYCDQSITLHGGLYKLYGCDTRNRLTDIDLKNSSNSVLLAQDYDYDAASNVIEHVKGGATTSYEYDEIDQLVEESRSGYLANYTYDDNGNRLTRTINSVQEDYTYDNGDKLDFIKIGATTIRDFDYDAAGRTTGITYSGTTSALAYDFESRLTSITRSGVTTNTFAYNGLDTRTSRVDSGGTKTFKRMGAGVTAPVLSDGSNTFTPGLSTRNGSTTTYEHSGLKSSESRSNTSQTINASRQYDAFGNIASTSGTWTEFGYAGGFGYQEDGDHGLMLLGHRHYDSSTGRFITRDPSMEGSNWYSYCDNNALRWIDPLGLQKISPSQLVNLVKAVVDENWDSFFLIVELIAGVEIPTEIKELIENIPRPKKLLSNPGKVAGDIRNIIDHARKVAVEPGANAVKKWKGEIVGSMKKLYKKQEP